MHIRATCLGFCYAKHLARHRFSFTDAETTCRKWREKFAGFDVSENRTFISVREQSGSSIEVSYLGNEYRLLIDSGILEKRIMDEWSEKLQMNEALTVYHYLGDEKKTIHQSGNWVPEHFSEN